MDATISRSQLNPILPWRLFTAVKLSFSADGTNGGTNRLYVDAQLPRVVCCLLGKELCLRAYFPDWQVHCGRSVNHVGGHGIRPSALRLPVAIPNLGH